MGYIRWQDARDVRANYRGFEEDQRIGKRIQVPLGSTPRVRYGQVGAFTGAIMSGHLSLTIVRNPRVPKGQYSIASHWAEQRIQHKEGARMIFKIAHPEAYIPAHFAFEFDIPSKRTGARFGTDRRAGHYRRGTRGEICVFQSYRLAHHCA